MSDVAPTAYLHTLDNTDGIEGNSPLQELTFSADNPFGKPGRNYSEEYPWTVEPLYTSNELTRLRADLAAVTTERDRMREALRPFGEALKDNYSMQVDELPIIAGSNQMDIRFKWTLGDLRRARAAIEGVTKKEGAGNETQIHNV